MHPGGVIHQRCANHPSRLLLSRLLHASVVMHPICSPLARGVIRAVRTTRREPAAPTHPRADGRRARPWGPPVERPRSARAGATLDADDDAPAAAAPGPGAP